MLEVISRSKSTSCGFWTAVKWLISRSHSLFQKLQAALSVFVVLAAIIGGHSLLIAETVPVRHHILRWLVVLRSSLFVLNRLHTVCKSRP